MTVLCACMLPEVTHACFRCGWCCCRPEHQGLIACTSAQSTEVRPLPQQPPARCAATQLLHTAVEKSGHFWPISDATLGKNLLSYTCQLRQHPCCVLRLSGADELMDGVALLRDVAVERDAVRYGQEQ